MMQGILSRYRPRYIRSLVYMLQACEYDTRDYLAWYGRTVDFSRVERRKKLVKTPKALTLLALAWTTIILWSVLVMWFVNSTGSDIPLVVGALVVLAMPFYLPYALLIILYVLEVAQLPVEAYLLRKAWRILRKHRACRIAIAGSFGKTSIREILKTVLGAGKRVAAPPFSHNTPIGIARFIGGLRGDEDVLIFELGEYYPGDVMELCKLTDPQIGIITGVNEAHLERFGTLEKTASTIFELAEYLKDKSVYVNGENKLARAHASEKHIIYSREGVGDCRVENAQTGLNGTSFTLMKDGDKLPIKSKLLGLHNVGPLAAAAHIAYRLGFTDREVQEGIGKTSAFDHRLLPNEDKNGVTTIDDSYNGNPDGVRAVIEFLSSMKGRRRWYVTPGLVEMGLRAKEVHEEIGRQLAQAGIEKIVLTRNSVTPHIERGLRDAGYSGEILWFPDALQAFAALPHLTVKGDIVLLQNDWPDQYA